MVVQLTANLIISRMVANTVCFPSTNSAYKRVPHAFIARSITDPVFQGLLHVNATISSLSTGSFQENVDMLLCCFQFYSLQLESTDLPDALFAPHFIDFLYYTINVKHTGDLLRGCLHSYVPVSTSMILLLYSRSQPLFTSYLGYHSLCYHGPSARQHA